MKPGPGKGLKLNLEATKAEFKDNEITLSYKYTVEYVGGIGEIRMEGEIVDRRDKKSVDDIKKKSKGKAKDLPPEYREEILPMLNFILSSEAVLAAKVVRLPPPLIPPRITKA